MLILSFIIPTGEASDDWSVPLSVLLDSTDKGEWIFGINSDATDGYDSNIDVPNPPSDPSGFDMYFSEPDYPATVSKLRNNFKSTDGVWTLVITVPAGTTAIVAWNSLPADTDMYLQEVEVLQTSPLMLGNVTGSAVDMKHNDNITVIGTDDNTSVTIRAFKIIMAPFNGGGGGAGGGGGFVSNLILNPSFEYLTLGQPDNWTLSGTASVTNTSSSGGNNSLNINASISGDILFANQTLDIYHVAGKSYTFTFDIARSGGISGDAISFYLNYIDFNATEQSLYVWTPNPNDDSNFWMYYHEQIIPSDAFNITGFEMRTNGTGEYWIDNLSLAIEQTPPSFDLYQNYTIEVIDIDIDGSDIWLELDKNGNPLEDIVLHNLSTYEYRNATSDLIINGTVGYIKFLNNNRSWVVLLEDIWQFSDVDGSVLINGTYNTFFGGEQYHDANVLPSGSAVLDIYESTGDVFSFDIGEVENDFMMVEGDAALMFDQTLNISGNLVDMGAVPIYTVTAAPTTGYVNGSVSPVLGHTYCINISGKYAKFEIVDITTNNIVFNWAYQPSGSNNFGSFLSPTDTTSPAIQITNPVNGSTINIFNNTISGMISGSSELASAALYLNGEQVTYLTSRAFNVKVNYVPNAANNISVYAEDVYHNSNLSWSLVNVLPSSTNTTTTVPANNSTTVDMRDETDTLIELSTGNNSAAVAINVSASTNASDISAVEANGSYGLAPAQHSLGRYIQVNVTGDRANITRVNLSMYYTESDLDIDEDGAADLNASTLTMYWYDANNTMWMPLVTGVNYSSIGGPVVFGTGHSSTGQYIWADLNHFSSFALAANISRSEHICNLQSGWNMVSVPVMPISGAKVSDIFGGNVTTVFGWTGTRYQQIGIGDKLVPKEAYWMLSNIGYDQPITGMPLADTSHTLLAGWNMAGPVSDGVSMDSLSNVTTVFGWTGTRYVQITGTQELELTKGYWMLAGQDTTIQI